MKNNLAFNKQNREKRALPDEFCHYKYAVTYHWNSKKNTRRTLSFV